MRRSNFLFITITVVGLALGSGCSNGDSNTAFPDDVPSDGTDGAIDLPGTMDLGPGTDTGGGGFDTGAPPPADTGTATHDTGTAAHDTGTPPTDTGSSTGVCPPSCTYNSDCDSCWGPTEMHTGNFCCQSGICILSTTSCTAATTDSGTPPVDAGGMGGSGGMCFPCATNSDCVPCGLTTCTSGMCY